MQKQGSKLPENLVKKLQQKEHPKKWSAIDKLNILIIKVKD